MAKVSAGSRRYEESDSVPYELGSDAAVAGDAMTISAASGALVLTDGSNGFAGVLGSSTVEGGDEYGAASGDRVNLEIQGIVSAKVSATVGSSVSPGEKLVPGANGVLENVDDGTGSPVQAGPGDVQAWGEPDTDGFALVRLP